MAGPIDIKLMEGTNYANVFAACRNVYEPGEAVDQLLGPNITIKNMGGIGAIDPGMLSMWQNKENVMGGMEYGQVDRLAYPNGGAIDPKGAIPWTPKEMIEGRSKQMGYYAFPSQIAGADLVMNAGGGKIIDWTRYELAGIEAAAAVRLAQHIRGNGTNFYNEESGAWESISSQYVANHMPIFGFGRGNDTVANAVMSSVNTFEGKNRSESKYAKLRAKVANIQTEGSTFGCPNATTLAAITRKHFNALYIYGRVGGMHVQLIEVGDVMWQHATGLFDTSRNYTANDLMARYGFASIQISPKCTLVHNPEFVDPTQIDAWNPDYTYLTFADGQLPEFADVFRDQTAGYKVDLTTLWFALQLKVKYPGLHSRWHNVPLT